MTTIKELKELINKIPEKYDEFKLSERDLRDLRHGKGGNFSFNFYLDYDRTEKVTIFGTWEGIIEIEIHKTERIE